MSVMVDTKVGIVGAVAPWMSGGASVHASELIRQLSRTHLVSAVTPGRRSGQLSAPNVEIRIVPLAPYLSTLGTIFGSVRFLRDVSLIHSHDPRVSVLGQFLDKPLVTTVHGYLTLEAVANGITRPRRPLYTLYDAMIRQCVRLSSQIIAVDSRISSWLRGVYSARNVSVIYNGVDVNRFRPGIDGRRVRHALGLDSEALVILSAKHLVQKNGMEQVVLAMRSVLQSFPDAVLLLAGEGPLRRRITDLVTECGIEQNVVMLGQLPHECMPEVISACDVCVIPSVGVAGVEEATSIIMLEAMACGKPVVASAIGGLREVIGNESYGVLVPPADPVALATALNQILGNEGLRRAIGVEARRYVETHHSWETVLRRVVAIYETVAE